MAFPKADKVVACSNAYIIECVGLKPSQEDDFLFVDMLKAMQSNDIRGRITYIILLYTSGS